MTMKPWSLSKSRSSTILTERSDVLSDRSIERLPCSTMGLRTLLKASCSDFRPFFFYHRLHRNTAYCLGSYWHACPCFASIPFMIAPLIIRVSSNFIESAYNKNLEPAASVTARGGEQLDMIQMVVLKVLPGCSDVLWGNSRDALTYTSKL
jgi:hypothetical protein